MHIVGLWVRVFPVLPCVFVCVCVCLSFQPESHVSCRICTDCTLLHFTALTALSSNISVTGSITHTHI